MARSTPDDTPIAEQFDPTQPLIPSLHVGWRHDADGSTYATEDAHATSVHVYLFDGPYTVELVQYREANEYSIQRTVTGETPTDAPGDETVATTDPGGLVTALRAANELMGDVTRHYTGRPVDP